MGDKFIFRVEWNSKKFCLSYIMLPEFHFFMVLEFSTCILLLRSFLLCCVSHFVSVIFFSEMYQFEMVNK